MSYVNIEIVAMCVLLHFYCACAERTTYYRLKLWHSHSIWWQLLAIECGYFPNQKITAQSFDQQSLCILSAYHVTYVNDWDSRLVSNIFQIPDSGLSILNAARWTQNKHNWQSYYKKHVKLRILYIILYSWFIQNSEYHEIHYRQTSTSVWCT